MPAPNLLLLALAVLAPELAPWIAGACVLAALLCRAIARGHAAHLAYAVAGVALACSLVPIVESPLASADAVRELDAQLGPEATRSEPATTRPIAIRRGLPVVVRDGTRLGLDLYTPAGSGAHPAIVTIYGGAWIYGDRTQMASIDRDYASRGYTVLAIDYRHAPAFRFPTEIDDVDDALATIARNAAAWHVDPNDVTIFGRSAGAELALLAAYRRAPQPLRIRAVIAYYAPTDLTAGYRDPPVPDPADIRRILRLYLGGTPDEKPDAYRRASPLALVRPGLPPTLLIAGDRDELIRIAFQRGLRDALRAHGDRVVAVEIPWSNHAFDEVPGGLGGRLATAVTARFLAALHAPERAARAGGDNPRVP